MRKPMPMPTPMPAPADRIRPQGMSRMPAPAISKGFSKGGVTRGDGCAQRGKTRGKVV